MIFLYNFVVEQVKVFNFLECDMSYNQEMKILKFKNMCGIIYGSLKRTVQVTLY